MLNGNLCVMEDKKLSPGDEVFHVSDPKLIMAVERIDERGVHCSWIHPKTFEQRDGVFSPLSLRKKPAPGWKISTVGSLP